MWCYVMLCDMIRGYAVSGGLVPCIFFRYLFLYFRHCLNQLSGVWHAAGPHDLPRCRDADRVWQRWRYKLSLIIGVIRITFTFIWCSIMWDLYLIVYCFSGGWSSATRTKPQTSDEYDEWVNMSESVWVSVRSEGPGSLTRDGALFLSKSGYWDEAHW